MLRIILLVVFLGLALVFITKKNWKMLAALLVLVTALGALALWPSCRPYPTEDIKYLAGPIEELANRPNSGLKNKNGVWYQCSSWLSRMH